MTDKQIKYTATIYADNRIDFNERLDAEAQAVFGDGEWHIVGEISVIKTGEISVTKTSYPNNPTEEAKRWTCTLASGPGAGSSPNKSPEEKMMEVGLDKLREAFTDPQDAQ